MKRSKSRTGREESVDDDDDYDDGGGGVDDRDDDDDDGVDNRDDDDGVDDRHDDDRAGSGNDDGHVPPGLAPIYLKNDTRCVLDINRLPCFRLYRPNLLLLL